MYDTTAHCAPPPDPGVTTTMTDAPTVTEPAVPDAAAAYAAELVPVLAEIIGDHTGAKGPKATAAATAIVEHMSAGPLVTSRTPMAGVLDAIRHIAAALPPVPADLDAAEPHAWLLNEDALPTSGDDVIVALRTIAEAYAPLNTWNALLQAVRRQLWNRGRNLDQFAPPPKPGDGPAKVQTARLAAASGVTATMVRTATRGAGPAAATDDTED